ncbi:MAG: hypothetical protein J5958_01030 [Clostridia bacterium]|nr:hypothetical protein [Clostridia bacterium]
MKVKMKVRDKIVLWIWIALCVAVYALLLRSCVRTNFPTDKRRAEIKELFDSLPHTDEYALQRRSRWIIRGETYNLGNPLYLDQNGFYTYSTRYETEPLISFYYAKYDDLEPELLGSSVLPSTYTPIKVAYYDGNFYYRAETPGEDGGYEYRTYRWNVNDQVAVETDEDDPSAIAEQESDYEFDFDGYIGFSTFRWYKRVKITEKSTGITKTVGKKILKSCPEGKQIYRMGPFASKFIAAARVVSGDDIYFLFRFFIGLNLNEEECYYYIVKWNFHTEECTFITTVEGFDSGCDHFLLFD